jgi:hypothetical protein
VAFSNSRSPREYEFATDRPSAITVFGGLMTDNDWQDAFAPWALDFRDSIGLKQRF